MFVGGHAINMDAKGRLAIPARVRETLADACAGRVVVTAHPTERCLLIYPEAKWEEILPSIVALKDFNKADARIKRLMMGNACAMELDANGRILLSAPLRTHARLEKKLLLQGIGESFELWGEEQLEAYTARVDESQLSEQAQSLSL